MGSRAAASGPHRRHHRRHAGGWPRSLSCFRHLPRLNCLRCWILCVALLHLAAAHRLNPLPRAACCLARRLQREQRAQDAHQVARRRATRRLRALRRLWRSSRQCRHTLRRSASLPSMGSSLPSRAIWSGTSSSSTRSGRRRYTCSPRRVRPWPRSPVRLPRLDASIPDMLLPFSRGDGHRPGTLVPSSSSPATRQSLATR